MVLVVGAEAFEFLKHRGREEERVGHDHIGSHGVVDELVVNQLFLNTFCGHQRVHALVICLCEEVGHVLHHKTGDVGHLLLVDLIGEVFHQVFLIVGAEVGGERVGSFGQERIVLLAERVFRVRQLDIQQDAVVSSNMLVGVVHALVVALVGEETADVFHKAEAQNAEHKNRQQHAEKRPQGDAVSLEETVDGDEKVAHFWGLMEDFMEKHSGIAIHNRHQAENGVEHADAEEVGAGTEVAHPFFLWRIIYLDGDRMDGNAPPCATH